ncbi:uncharacterized protein LOC106065725 isoform X2 [Biomphalaria glabrata]|uniref:Uncharacterized protein LOC106065725 isoform X2 n=1 Tax=Biomphalaria glabrata TaxID=6526 RepID=A0A9W2YX47_BIOGL|nr:uncharacterized protein LOC106065725 isoform X2 [Biomphalaria glabrata]
MRTSALNLFLLCLPVAVYTASITLKQRHTKSQCDKGRKHFQDDIVFDGLVDTRPGNRSDLGYVLVAFYDIDIDLVRVVRVNLDECDGYTEIDSMHYCKPTSINGVYSIVHNSTAYLVNNGLSIRMSYLSDAETIKTERLDFPKAINRLSVHLTINDISVPLTVCNISDIVKGDVIKFCCHLEPATCNVSIIANFTKVISNKICVQLKSKYLQSTHLSVGYTYCQETKWIKCHFQPINYDDVIKVPPYYHENSLTQCDAGLKAGTDKLVMYGLLDINRLPYSESHKINVYVELTGEKKGTTLMLPTVHILECTSSTHNDEQTGCHELKWDGFYRIFLNITVDSSFNGSNVYMTYFTTDLNKFYLESPKVAIPSVIDTSSDILEINGETSVLNSCNEESIIKDKAINICCLSSPATCHVSMVLNNTDQISGTGCIEYSSNNIPFSTLQINYVVCGERKSITCNLPQTNRNNQGRVIRDVPRT